MRAMLLECKGVRWLVLLVSRTSPAVALTKLLRRARHMHSSSLSSRRKATPDKQNTRKPYRIDISPPTDDRRMSRMRPLRRAADVGPPPKMDQNRSVSSAAADTTVSPSGDWAKCNTRAVWPVSSQSFVIDG